MATTRRRSRIRIRGKEQTKAAFRALGEEMRGLLERAVADSTANILRNARELVPVRTGALRDSLEMEIDEGGRRGRVGTPSTYAVFVEFARHGTPFLFPAWERERPEFLKAIKAGAPLAGRRARRRGGRRRA